MALGANVFSGTPGSVIPLILGQAVKVLRKRIGLLVHTVNNDMQPVDGYRGEVVNFARTQPAATYPVVPSNAWPAVVNTQLDVPTVTVSNFQAARLNVTEQEVFKLFADEDFIAPSIDECIAGLAADIENSIWAALEGNIWGMSGVIGDLIWGNGATPDSRYLADAKVALDRRGVSDVNRACIIGHDEESKALIVPQLTNQYQGARTDLTLKEGVIGRLYAMDIFTSAYRLVHLNGTWNVVTTNGASIAGATTLTLATGGALNGLKGDIFEFTAGGNYAAHKGQQYVLTADRAGAGLATFYPPLVASLAGGETVVLTKSQADATAYPYNVALQKGCLGFVQRLPAQDVLSKYLGSAPNYWHYTDPISGLMLTCCAQTPAQGAYHLSQLEVCALWGVGVIDGRKGQFIIG